MQSLAGIKIPTKELSETCVHHPDVHMRQFRDHKPFCPICQQEKMNKERIAFDRKITAQNIKKVFYDESLFANAKENVNETFANYEAEEGSIEAKLGNEAYKIAMEYIKYPKKEMTTVFSGKPGKGKTHLALAIANKVVNESHPMQRVRFIDTSSLFDHIKQSWEKPTEDWTQFMSVERMSNVDLLVIDDLGSESNMRPENSKDDRPASQIISDVLKRVLDRQHRIIITTNLTFDKLKKVYDPKLVSRMFAHSMGRRINFDGIEDRRLLS